MADVGAETLAAGAGQVPKPADTPPAVPDYKTMPTPPAMSTGGGGGGIPQAGLRDALSRYSAGVGDAQGRIRAASASVDNLRPPAPLQLPPPPQPHTTDFMSAFGSAAMALAGLGSLMTRQPLVNALNAGTAVLNAYHQNDMKEAQLQFQQWQTAVKNAESMQRFEQQAYSSALAKARIQPELARAEMTTLAASFKDQVVHSMVSKGDLSGAANILMGRSKALGSMVSSSGEIAYRHEIGTKIREAMAAGDKDAVQRLTQEAALREYEKTGKKPPGFDKLMEGGKGAGKPPTLTGIKTAAVQAKIDAEVAKQEKDLGRSLTPVEKANVELGQIRDAGDLTPNAMAAVSNTYSNVLQGLNGGDDALKALRKVPGLVGIGGKIGRPLEAIGNVLGSDQTAKADFMLGLKLMMEHYTKAVQSGMARPLAADQKIIAGMFDGTSLGRTTANVTSAIEHIQKELYYRKTYFTTMYPYLERLDSIGVTDTTANPPPAPANGGVDPSLFPVVKQ